MAMDKTKERKNAEHLFDLSQEDLQTLLKYGKEKTVAKGEEIFGEGDDPDAIYLVKDGRVHMTKASTSGAESLVAFYEPGSTFCVAASIIGKPYPCAARAALDSVIISIPSARFLELFEKLPSFAKRLLHEMAPQFCEAHCDCALSVESVDKRLAYTLLRLDKQFQGRAIPFTRQELAQMVNTTVESCIRTLSAWTKDGWVEGVRGELKVVQRKSLEALLEE